MRRYILSAGRTGTVFLTHLLNEIDGIQSVHEPSPTRWQMMLANARNDFGIGNGLLKTWFNKSRQKSTNKGDIFVELNPFLCALADLIPQEGVETRVVHLVRHPADWATSMTVFKASTRFRHVIDFVPFAKPYPAPRPEGWHQLPDFEKALWRWRWCNERLLSIGDNVAGFSTLRSEDLLSNTPHIRQTTSKALFECLHLPGNLPKDFADDSQHRNARPDGKVDIPRDAVRRICGTLATKLGYDV